MRGVAVVVLSDKSSGSSLLQRLLVSAGGRTVEHTPHMEGETLFWAKAIAALGGAQPRMMDSRVIPMGQAVAERQLLDFLTANTGRQWQGPVDETMIRDGWAALVEHHGPVFVEKSPHHLHNAEACDLMIRLSREAGVDLRLVGLVRHPVDTLYSMWSRWGVPPGRRQGEWVRAYSNLLRLDTSRHRLFVVRYEDLASRMAEVADHCGLTIPDVEQIRPGSAGWRTDSAFRFRPSAELEETATRFGYDVSVVAGDRLRWTLLRVRRSVRTHLSRWRRAGRGRAGPAR